MIDSIPHDLDPATLQHPPQRAIAAIFALAMVAVGCERPMASGADAQRTQISVSPKVVELGTVPRGETASAQLRIANNADSAVEISDVEISCECVKLIANLPIVIDGASSTTLFLSYQPEDGDGFQGSLSVEVRGKSRAGDQLFHANVNVEVSGPGGGRRAGEDRGDVSRGANAAAEATDNPGSQASDSLRGRCADLIAKHEAQTRGTDPPKPDGADGKLPQPGQVAVRLLELIRAQPGDPGGCDALCWIALNCPDDPSFDESIDLLAKHHTKGPDAERLSSALAKARPPADRVMRAIVDQAPDPAKGHAYLALARRYRRRAESVKALRNEPRTRKNWESSFGKAFTDAYAALDPQELTAESDRLFDEARRRGFSDLEVGQPAPEIVGNDTDGNPMRLSDFRGRVVVISFWGTWCGPCMGMVPEERELVRRYAGRPFVLLGVNTDQDRRRLAEVMKREGIAWRSWWDGGNTIGPIASGWDVFVWPSVFVVDARGTLRFKCQAAPDPEKLRKIIEDLLEEGGVGK